MAWVKQNDTDANIIFIDLTKLKFEDLKEYHKLNDYVESHFEMRKSNFLFIDEVQLCDGFELVINILYSFCKLDIYLIGLNWVAFSSGFVLLFVNYFIISMIM